MQEIMQNDSKVQDTEPLPPPKPHKEKHVAIGEFIKSAVYGGLDGIITTFSIALSAFGGSAGVDATVGLGISSLIADGLSMGIADYLATKSDEEFMLSEKARELEEIENDLEAEKVQMVKIYTELGETKEDATEIVEILAVHKDGFLDVMMIEELGLSSDDENPLTNSLVTFFSFGIFGLMPLLPFVVAKGSQLPWQDTYVWVSAILTVIFLFILGFSKSLIVLSRWWYSGLEAIFIGGLSAGVAYGIGVAFGENK